MQNSEYRRIGDLREINSDKRRISAKNINSNKHPLIFKKTKHKKHAALSIICLRIMSVFIRDLSDRWTYLNREEVP